MKVFFDTNVLVYLFDADSPDKRKRARALFQAHAGAGDILLSTQVLQEFYVAVTRKLARPLDAAAAEEAAENFAQLPMVNIDAKLVLSAIHRSRASRLSFWDSLVVQAAIEGHATTLYSEDMHHGLTVDGLKVVNPFLGR
jgi:predicted nucleic acid-binding protein